MTIMDFIGVDSSTSIPVPNLNFSPEMICKNFPLDFLLQPIIPLLPPPVAEKTYFIIIPSCIKAACLGISGCLQRPLLQVIGASFVATGVAYVAWKLSLKWNEDLFNPMFDPDASERLDEEVERIMSTVPEENTFSTCFSFTDKDLNTFTSCNSSITTAYSHDICSCSEVAKPLALLQSRIDQVMSRVEDVVNGLKALESCRNLPRTETESKEKEENMIGVVEQERKIEIQQKENSPKQNLPLNETRQEIKEEDMAQLHQDVKELEVQLETIKSITEHGKKMKRTRRNSSLSPICSDKWDKSPSVIILSNESQEVFRKMSGSMSSLSPPYFKTDDSPFRNARSRMPSFSSPLFGRSPLDRKRISPMRNVRKNTRPRNYDLRPFPNIPENPPRCNQYLRTIKDNTAGNEISKVEPQSTKKDNETNKYQFSNEEYQRKFPIIVENSPLCNEYLSTIKDNTEENEISKVEPQPIMKDNETNKSQFSNKEYQTASFGLRCQDMREQSKQKHEISVKAEARSPMKDETKKYQFLNDESKTTRFQTWRQDMTTHKYESQTNTELHSLLKPETNKYQQLDDERQEESFEKRHQDTWPKLNNTLRLSYQKPEVDAQLISGFRPYESSNSITTASTGSALAASHLQETTATISKLSNSQCDEPAKEDNVLKKCDENSSIKINPSQANSLSMSLTSNEMKNPGISELTKDVFANLNIKENATVESNKFEFSFTGPIKRGVHEPDFLISKKTENSKTFQVMNTDGPPRLNIDETIQASNNFTFSVSDLNKGEATEGKTSQKHKLFVPSDTGPSPSKLPRRDDTIFSSHTSGDETYKNLFKIPREHNMSTPQTKTSLRSFSPFKKASRKRNDYQVKYIPKGKTPEETVSSPQPQQADKEDEWIVIVPTNNNN